MSVRQQFTAGISGFALMGLYSAIMMATAGTAASWAWILLVGAIGLLVMTARSVAKAGAERRGG
jgi:hypothetical protein